MIAIAGVSLPGFLLKALGFLPVIIVAAFWLFDHWLWREGPFPNLTHTPDLRGTWKGTLTSIRDDGTGQVVEHDPIPIFLTIDQTYLSLDIALMSAESSSRSFATTLQRNNGDSHTVYYHYTNNPKLTFRPRSPIHAGGSRLEVAGLNPTGVSGEYWTDRQTMGSYEAQLLTRNRLYRWEDAVKVSTAREKD